MIKFLFKSQKKIEDPLSDYFSGLRLYGDDFSYEEIKQWYEDEKEGYAELGNKSVNSYSYSYHALNYLHGYRYLPNKIFSLVLSIGGAYGDELLPIIHKIEKIFILEPSKYLRRPLLEGKPVHYIEPSIEGVLPFPNNYFDLVTCFGVLHHIPNVSFVMKEIFRVTKRGGYLLCREPIVSLGDWRYPRKGLTKRERGIPLKLMKKIIIESGFKVVKATPCMFPLTRRIGLGFFAPFNSTIVVILDMILSYLFMFNYRYHPRNIVQKLTPSSYFWVLKKE